MAHKTLSPKSDPAQYFQPYQSLVTNKSLTAQSDKHELGTVTESFYNWHFGFFVCLFCYLFLFLFFLVVVHFVLLVQCLAPNFFFLK